MSTSIDEIFWRSDRAPIIEAEGEYYVIQAFLEGQSHFEEWAILPTPDMRDASITVHAAEAAVGTYYENRTSGEQHKILATRVRRVRW
jgi:hypothetical protein